MWLRVWILCLYMLLAGCNLGVSNEVSVTPSAWGNSITLAQTQQMDAPAIVRLRETTLAAWFGADEASPRIGVTVERNNTVFNARLLDLLLVYPYGQRFAPARDGNALLFFLDAPFGETDLGTQLNAMLLSPTGEIIRFPVRVSTARTAHYDILPNGDGSVQVVWSGGPIAEPNLTIAQVDALARPRAGAQIAQAADWPAIVRTNDGVTRLFWLSAVDATVRRGILNGEALSSPVTLMPSPPLFDADLLLGFDAALDRTHVYLFWTIERADRSVETWLASAPLDADELPDAWMDPQRLGVVPSEAPFVTGFNGGDAQFAIQGMDWVRYAVPLTGQFDLLPVVAQWQDSLAMVYLRGGEVVALQSIAELDADLIGFPSIATDRDLHLYLTWSAWPRTVYGDLRMVTTRS